MAKREMSGGGEERGVSYQQVSAESICLLIQNAHSTQRVALLVCLNLAAGNLHFSLRSQAEAGRQLECSRRGARAGWGSGLVRRASAILTPRTVHGVKS